MLNEALAYNLLAVCQSPLTTISRSMAANLASARALDGLFQGNPAWTVPDPSNTLPETRLARLGLTREAVAATPVPPVLVAETGKPGFGMAAAEKLARDLQAEREALEAEHAAEMATVEEAVAMIRGRQRDYTPAIHEWVSILAEKGALRGLISEADATADAADGF